MNEKIKALRAALKESGQNVKQLTKEADKATKVLGKAQAAHEKLEARLAKLMPAMED